MPIKYYDVKVLLKRFHLNGNIIGFQSHIQKLELHTKSTVPCESTAEKVSLEWSHERVSYTDSKVRTKY